MNSNSYVFSTFGKSKSVIKNLFSLTALSILILADTGCKRPKAAHLPNVTAFAVQSATNFVPGNGATVTLSVPSLGQGTFTANYSLTSATTQADNIANLSAPIQVNSSGGTFQTAVIPAGGLVTITVNSISNESGSSLVTRNNTWSLIDSTGIMTWTYSFAGTTSPLRAMDIKATLSGANLTIIANMWTPDDATITLRNKVYSGVAGTVNFSPADTSAAGAMYQVSGIGVNINNVAVSGSITLTSTAPLLSGTFSFTNHDGSVVSGTFTCPKP